MKSKAASLDSPVWFNIGSMAVTRRRAGVFIAAAGVLIGIALFWGRFDLKTLHDQAERLPAALVVALLVLLPLGGFPVSWLHLVAGARFGFWPGLAVVLITSVLQNVLAWNLVQWVPRRYFARLKPWKKRLAGVEHSDAILFCGLAPGMPYMVQLYLLPIIGVSLRNLCLWSATLITARATVTILLGNISDQLSVQRIGWLIVYYAILTGISAWVLRNLRRSLHQV